MADYIDRDAAIARIKEYASDIYGIDLDDSTQFDGDGFADNFCEGLWSAIELIDDIPTVGGVSVRHGRWKWETRDIYRCTNCNKRACFKEAIHRPVLDFCPNCGARMDGDGNG